MPNCPYCDANVDSMDDIKHIRDNPSEDFDFHYIQITCESCGDTYELCYDLARIMVWDEEGDPSIIHL